MKNENLKILWGAVFGASAWYSFTVIDKSILPQVEKVEYKSVQGIGPGAGAYRIPKDTMVANPWDAYIKFALLLVVVVSYWLFLQQIISNPTLRVTIFLLSIPLAYLAFLVISFLIYF